MQVACGGGELASFKHDQPLQKNVQDAIKPVYQALSVDDLLQRCTGGNTQNSNECFNGCVWRLAPKHLHSASQTMESVTCIVANLFNEGGSSLLKTMNTLGVAIGSEAAHFARTSDNQRLQAAERRVSSYARMAYLEKKTRAISPQEQFELEEGLLYGPGIAE